MGRAASCQRFLVAKGPGGGGRPCRTVLVSQRSVDLRLELKRNVLVSGRDALDAYEQPQQPGPVEHEAQANQEDCREGDPEGDADVHPEVLDEPSDRRIELDAEAVFPDAMFREPAIPDR